MSMIINRRTAISPGRTVVGPAWTPATLFAASEQGVWFDPTDTTTLFQDSVGTTPVTAVEQPVGLIFDKSRGLVLGSELVTNGTFTTDTDWTKPTNGTISGGSANFAPGGGATANFQQSKTGLSNTFVRIQYTVLNFVAGQVQLRIGGSGGITASPVVTANGTYSATLRVNGDLVFIQLLGVDTSNLSVDNVSVRELPGNHASQSSSTARPTLRARYNLLTQTEDFSQAVWGKVAGSSFVVDDAVAPNGTTTADKFREVNGGTNHYFYQNPTLPAAIHTYSIYAKAAERSWLALDYAADATRRAFFDLSTGQLGAVGANCTATIAAVTGAVGWYRCTLTVTTTASANWWVNWIAEADNDVAYTGDGTSGVYIWGADLKPAQYSSLPYQRVTTATDYDANPLKFPAYLDFDGGDWLQTSAINFSATDKVAIVAGANKQSDAAEARLVQLGADNTAGGFAVLAPQSASNPSYSVTVIDSAATSGGQRFRTYTAPTSDVVAIALDYSKTAIDEVVAVKRIDGAVPATVETTGAGTLAGSTFAANAALTIGKRGAVADRYFTGRIHQLIVRGATTDAANIRAAERFVSIKTGINF